MKTYEEVPFPAFGVQSYANKNFAERKTEVMLCFSIANASSPAPCMCAPVCTADSKGDK